METGAAVAVAPSAFPVIDETSQMVRSCSGRVTGCLGVWVNVPAQEGRAGLSGSRPHVASSVPALREPGAHGDPSSFWHGRSSPASPHLVSSGQKSNLVPFSILEALLQIKNQLNDGREQS